jgi:hypothetical protein
MENALPDSNYLPVYKPDYALFANRTSVYLDYITSLVYFYMSLAA